MDAPEAARAALIQNIVAAFANVERGSGVSLHEAYVIGDYGSDQERSAARVLDTDSRWQDVPDSLIEGNHSILNFLDAEGLRYYLPAYMVWSLEHCQSSDSASSDAMIFTLDISPAKNMREWQMRRFGLLTDVQRRVICRFLCFIAEAFEDYTDVDTARHALASYWDQFG